MSTEPLLGEMATTSTRKNIIIIGGSNTGLMHGVVLKRLGHNVRILEQNCQSERADLAAGITTHLQFERFMEVHDRSKEPWSIASPGIQWLNRDAGVKRVIKKPLQMTSWSLIYYRLRANFDGYASSFCARPPLADEGDGTAVFDLGKKATELSRVDDSVRVDYISLIDDQKPGTFYADLVILADGASSNLRQNLFPDVKRDYAGYVAFRGTVDEDLVPDPVRQAFDEKLTYFCFKGNYILMYIIPGASGSLQPGHRRYNWVWYHPLAAASPALTQIMTDRSGTLHRTTLPAGSMDPLAWAAYKQLAHSQMCTPFATLVSLTTDPFVTAVTDVSCPRAAAWDNRVLIAGEALRLVRPHMALSTTASARQALLLEQVLFFCRGRGQQQQQQPQLSLEDWERKVLYDATLDALKSGAFGTALLYGPLAAAGWCGRLLLAVIRAKLPFGFVFSALPESAATKKSGSSRDR
ncbi:monooxygenase [Drepanopeziza brunnea f. sp. 'multigermtubi' MB_m1]|uniref:Monooxygenase n=2 Tax=Drepanopeziza brunnea f. sp. 'multigermtubi' TaxID=698441 RepID=K1Y0G5_MARBU|nr:monooxygenase [Drepanopeziza brunnea f. sp. 'multigermtubi' MB_m1]EKD18599.1 monooxygenase [Drepanopeziza brunnea f. sp. 'multigermtubi' MB_m1]